MISPMTSPGTKCVVIAKGNIILNRLASNGNGPKIGEVVTVAKVIPSPVDSARFVALLQEHKWAFSLDLLRRVDLPECLTKFLKTEPMNVLPVHDTAGGA